MQPPPPVYLNHFSVPWRRIITTSKNNTNAISVRPYPSFQIHLHKRLEHLTPANINLLADPFNHFQKEHVYEQYATPLHFITSINFPFSRLKGESQPLKNTRETCQSEGVDINSVATSSLYLSANNSRKSKLSTNRKPPIGSS